MYRNDGEGKGRPAQVSRRPARVTVEVRATHPPITPINQGKTRGKRRCIRQPNPKSASYSRTKHLLQAQGPCSRHHPDCGNREVINTDENQVFIKFIPLIKYTINKYYPEYLFDDDVFQEASIALLRAIRAYDENRRVMFTTFAIACIRNGIKTYLRDKRVKERPDETVYLEDYLKYDSASGASLLIDTLSDVLGVDNMYDVICYIDFRDFYCGLNNEQKIIVRMLLNGNTTSEIGKVFGVSHQAISLRINTIRNLYRKFLKGE